MKFYTYVHRRADDNLIFYVGKGNGKRAYSFSKRNAYWNRIAKKHGVRVEIWAKFNDEQSAFDFEKQLIILLRNWMPLTNLTDGGEGTCGWIPDEKYRQKMSQLKSNPSDEIRKKLSLVNKGIPKSQEHKNNIKKARQLKQNELGKPITIVFKNGIKKTFPLIKQASEFLGVDRTTIHFWLRGKKPNDKWQIGEIYYVDFKEFTRVPKQNRGEEQTASAHGPADGHGPGQDNHNADHHQGQDADHSPEGGSEERMATGG